MGIEVTFVDEASGADVAQSVLEPEQLPETFAFATSVRLGEEDWRVVAAEPVNRADIARAGRLRLTVRRSGPVEMVPARTLKFSMPTICDPLPPADPSVSLADLRIFVVDEDLWRDVEWVPRRYDADVAENFAAVRAIRESAPQHGPFPSVHQRATPVTPLLGAGLTVTDVVRALGQNVQRLDGVGIETMGGGFVRGGFAFKLPEDTYVYGYCEGAEIAAMGVHRDGPRDGLPIALARLLGTMWEEAAADLVVWTYCERIDGLGALEDWYTSGRACTKMLAHS